MLAWPVEIGRLPRWISERAARHGLALDAEGAALLAERVEGNLLAAHQEIEKLALLHPRGKLGYEDVQDAVANSARYDVFQLGEAALEGDAARSLRILEGLRAEGTEAPLVLWVLCRELRGARASCARIPARRWATAARPNAARRCCVAPCSAWPASRSNRCSSRPRTRTGRSRDRAAAMPGSRSPRSSPRSRARMPAVAPAA